MLSWVRVSISVLVVAFLVAVTAIAYSEPIDPSWPGYWDDDDSDNAVVAIVCACALDAPKQTGSSPPLAVGIDLPLPRILELSSPLDPAAASRAPPAAVAPSY